MVGKDLHHPLSKLNFYSDFQEMPENPYKELARLKKAFTIALFLWAQADDELRGDPEFGENVENRLRPRQRALICKGAGVSESSDATWKEVRQFLDRIQRAHLREESK